MGRRAKVRTSYSHDAAFLARLTQAIEDDPKAPPEWKAAAMSLANKLSRKLMEETERRFL